MEKIYTAQTTSTGGRKGTSSSDDNKLAVSLSIPTELGGDGGDGTNPEQLFAAGYSACFIGAMQHVAKEQKLALSDNVSATAHVSIGENDTGVGFAIAVELLVSVPDMEQNIAEKLVEDAHQVCPYSNATRGNIEITTTVN